MSKQTNQETIIQYDRPPLYKKQVDAFFCEERYSIIEGSTKCFTGDTLVHTRRGVIKIEDVRAGDLVYTEHLGEIILKPVRKVYKHTGDYAMIRVTTREGVIHATRNHEFKSGGGWHPISIIAGGELANKRGFRLQILCKQFWEGCFRKIQGYRRKDWCSKTSLRREWLFTYDDFIQREEQDNKSSQAGRRGLVAGGHNWPYCEPQELQQVRQQGGEFRGSNIEGKYTPLSKSAEVWELSWDNKRELKVKRVGSCGDKRAVQGWRDLPEGAGGAVWRFQNNDKADTQWQGVEPRLISSGDILNAYEYLYSGTVYDLDVQDTHNYLVGHEGFVAHNSGKTVSCMAWLTEQCFVYGKEGRQYWWVAPVYPQAKIAFRRIKAGLPRDAYTANESELTITFRHNGATMCFKSGEKPDNLYGEDVYAAVLDEASRVRAESWYALRSTLTATRGPIRIIGNVKGRGNWFYKLARKAEQGEPNMRYTKIIAQDAVDARVLDAEEIEQARRDLPEAVFKELYECIPADDGGNPFSLKHIDLCVKPLSNRPPVCYGVDLAKSHDYTVITGLDDNGDVCDVHRFQKGWRETIRYIQNVCSDIYTVVDSTGVGDPILEELQTSGQYEGFKFTSNSKQMLMEGLAVAIQQQDIGFTQDIYVPELEVFEYEYTRTGVKYSAPEGLHDDAVCSLALAWYAFKQGVSSKEGFFVL